MPLHLQYRPQTLEEFYGNETLKTSLQSILARQDRPRAFLFTGPSGCGKTTLARIVAKEIGCHELDYSERNVSDARGIDDARRMISEMWYMPAHGEMKVYCLDECQGATPAFQESLLKALEDTPLHVTFLLCTTDPQKLKRTIKTRCSEFQVQPLPGPVMSELLADVLRKEFGESAQQLPSSLIPEIVQVADGCPRQALTVLDQVIDIPDAVLMIEAVRRSKVGETDLRELMDCLFKCPPWSRTSKVLEAMADSGVDWETVRRSVREWAAKVLLSKGEIQAAKIIHFFDGIAYDKASFVKAAFETTRR